MWVTLTMIVNPLLIDWLIDWSYLMDKWGYLRKFHNMTNCRMISSPKGAKRLRTK